MTALDETAARVEWCSAAHPFADLVICRRLRHPTTVLHSSTNTDDWASDAAPTPTNQENQR